jgi:hypothetical protein
MILRAQFLIFLNQSQIPTPKQVVRSLKRPQETYGRNFVDPSKIDKILDKAGGACQVRNVARAAAQVYDPAAGPLRFSFEVNKARNEETLVIDKVGRSHNFNIHKYTQSPICSD